MITFFLGLLTVIAVNADTIAISKSLSHDGALRSALSAAAQEYAKVDALKSQQTDSSSAAFPGSYEEACREHSHSPRCKLETNLAKIQNLGLPIGWKRDDPRTMPGGWGWPVKIIGWLLTAIAISVGAPFWFDLLNKFMVARSTVKPRDKAKKSDKQP